MPYHWQNNELFLAHGRYRIYYVSIDDFWDNGVREFVFGCTPQASDERMDNGEFDVRNLPNPQQQIDHNDVEGRKSLIRSAIDSGYFDETLKFGKFAVPYPSNCSHEPDWSTLAVVAAAHPPQLQIVCRHCGATACWHGVDGLITEFEWDESGSDKPR